MNAYSTFDPTGLHYSGVELPLVTPAGGVCLVICEGRCAESSIATSDTGGSGWPVLGTRDKVLEHYWREVLSTSIATLPLLQDDVKLGLPVPVPSPTLLLSNYP